ncbi:MAG: 2OG-Fe(II) oxygenase [Acidobacteria bacterium]|nr:2OG-Fe(II) oxygenase [Acidobacteriota bacterium]
MMIAAAVALEPATEPSIEPQLRQHGWAPLGRLLNPEQCQQLINLFDQPQHFRRHIRMEQFRFGRGEYQYFADPLPELVAQLRTQLYAPLAAPASRWMADLGLPEEYPPTLNEFLARCHQAGQTRPTPLLLRYQEGDYNCLHQDLYGSVVFPFQVVIGLNAPGRDFEGGELLLTEQRPRAQSMGQVIPLGQGEAVVITTRYRPVPSQRGFYRANVRHGVSPLRAGLRHTLGLIFHDAQ